MFIKIVDYDITESYMETAFLEHFGITIKMVFSDLRMEDGYCTKSATFHVLTPTNAWTVLLNQIQQFGDAVFRYERSTWKITLGPH